MEVHALYHYIQNVKTVKTIENNPKKNSLKVPIDKLFYNKKFLYKFNSYNFYSLFLLILTVDE